MSTESASKPRGDPPFMGNEPPHWAARGLVYFLISLFAVSAIISIFVHVPETVNGSFTLIPLRGTDPIRASRRGLISAVRIAEGESVAEGAPLYVIRSDPVGDRSAELGTLRMQLIGSREALVNARNQYESERRANEEERGKLSGRLTSLARTIELKKKQLALTRELAERYRAGYARGAVSATEYTTPQLEAEKLAEELERYDQERQETESAIEKQRYEVAARHAEYRDRRRDLEEAGKQAEIRIEALEKELVHSTGSALVIPAPCAGTVLKLRVNSPGAVVQEGDVLGEFACSDERLQGELIVPQSGVARIEQGQGVKLLYDAFPYQRYGVRHGRIRWISPSSVSASDSSAFRALIAVEDEAIRVGGQLRPLMAGMGGQAKVVVGRRSLVSYAFEPIRQLKESFAEVPAQ